MNRKLQCCFIQEIKQTEVHKFKKIKFHTKNPKLKMPPLRDAFAPKLVVSKNIVVALKMAKPVHKNVDVTTVGI
jgi:hypothetical protein